MSYLEGLRYVEDNKTVLEETKQGNFRFDGSPNLFEGWKFRITAKLSSVIAIKDPDRRQENYGDLVTRVLDGLSHDAERHARAIGTAKLMTQVPTTTENETTVPGTNGLQQLIDRIQSEILLRRAEISRELLRVGKQEHGEMTRQPT